MEKEQNMFMRKGKVRQAFVIVLAALMLFATLPSGASWRAVYATEWTNTSTEEWGLSISTDKAVYEEGDTVHYTIPDFTSNAHRAFGTDELWLGLYEYGASDGYTTSLKWEYINDDIKDGDLAADLGYELKAGKYFLILTTGNAGNDVNARWATLVFTVGEYIEPKVTLNKEGTLPQYKYGEPVMITAEGSDATAWFGVYEYDPDFPDGYYAKVYIKDVTGPVDLLLAAADNGTPLQYGEKYRIYLCINEEGNPNSIQFDKSLKFELLVTYGDPTWTWDPNHTTATATFTAKHDPTLTKDVTVTGDNITSAVTKEATEEEDGERIYTATITADMIDFVTENDPPFKGEVAEVIPKLTHVHNIEAVAAKEPTCEEAGNIAYYECTGCHKFFEDAEGTKEIEDKNAVVIAALGHDYPDTWTCDEESYSTENKTHSRECARCGKKETQACTFIVTQTDPDFEEHICSVCGGRFQKMLVPVITTDKPEYKVGEDIFVTTALNGVDGKTSGGWIGLYRKGSGNGTVYNTSSILWYYPDPSYWGSETKLLQSVYHPSDTNLENMGEWQEEWGSDLPLGDYELVFLTGGAKPPYTMVGHPCYFSVVRTIVKEEVTKEPTCTQPGTKHVVYNDGTEEDVEIPALGHDFDEAWVYGGAEAKTHHHVCKRCGESSDPEDCVFDEGKVTKEPTEKETGTMLYTCTICGGTYEEEIPTLADSGVRRAYGNNRYQTAMVQADLLKEELGLEKFDTIIVATGTNYADALSGAYLGYVNKAPILLVNGATVESVKDYIKKNVNEGGTVYLLGGEAVVPASVETGMDGFKFERLAGSNRYKTNIEILKAAGVEKEDILVCDGNNFADSLSASAVMRPILLVKGALNDDQRKYLESLPGNNYYMIGGTGAVPAEVENEIMLKYGSTSRIGGKNRYETSVAVAEAFFDKPEKAVVAYAMNYPDGLCGGPLAAYMNAPLLLVRDDMLTAAQKYTADNKIVSGIVLGGPALIADASARTLFGLAEDAEIYVVKYE